jgi:predicted ATPase/class 3 adenylate cyclase
MADVFISYSSADKAQAELLDETLVRAGFSVWWDARLLSGERFQQSITQELARAGAVLVVWSSTSVSSDWVYSEARRGNERGVLLQVRQRDVSIDDLPAPFDAFHCPFIDETDAITQAVARLVGRSASADGTQQSPVGRGVGLPTGTVTMLFCDIEGSAALAERSTDAWGKVLSTHRRICREAWSAHAGIEMGMEGDRFFVVFATAGAGVAAAAEAQQALAAHPWPEGAELKVRMGLHTGSPRRHENGYVGFDVHKAARIRSLAHGGQVVVSDSTAVLVGEDLPGGLDLRDLGEHRVDDVPGPVRVHQLLGPGLADGFPPLRSQGRAVNLPGTLTPLVGREAEVAEVVALFAGGRTRLVTVTGPGGTGKTRLSIAVAELLAGDYADEVCFVPLAGVTEVTTMWTTIAQALDLPPDGHLPPGFFDHASQRRVVLVLDNLEQIEEADAVVHELLQGAPHLRIVATSRRPLHVTGEHEYALGTLSLPATDEPQAVAASEAGQLFERCAARVRRGFEIDAANAGDVAALLRALDGLPLAIELAATRIKLFHPKALLARLDTVLDVAAGGAGVPERQRTLRAAIEWSFRLLAPEEQRLLARLSVFAGGADLDAVAAVAPPDLGADPVDVLLALVESSFVVPRYDVDPPRFGLLETVRRFAREHLDQLGETAAARQAHAQHYGAWIVDLRDRVRAGDSVTAEFNTELFNLHELLSEDHAPVIHPTEGVSLTPLQLRALVASLGVKARQLATVVVWTEPARIDRGRDTDPLGHLECRRARAFALGFSDSAASRALLTAVLDDLPESRTRTQDGAGVASAFKPDLIEATTMAYLTTVLVTLGMLDEAETVGQRALGLPGLVHVERGMLLDALCRLALQRGDLERAREHATEVRDLDETAGDAWGMAYDEISLADIDVRMQEFDRAHARLAAALPHVRLQEDVLMTISLAEAFAAALGPTAPGAAARAFGAVETALVAAGMKDHEPEWTRIQHDRLRERLGSVFEEELARGRALSLDEAIDELMSYPVPPVDVD